MAGFIGTPDFDKNRVITLGVFSHFF